jgi:hypothetical protein
MIGQANGSRRRSSSSSDALVGPSYRALSYSFRIHTNVASLRRELDRLLEPFRTAEGNGIPEYRLVHNEANRPQYAMFRDGERVRSFPKPEQLIDHLLWEVSSRALQMIEGFLAIHASVASWKGRAVVLPAPPDSGKTTLVAGLTQAGFDYLSDEAALIDPSTALVHPFPRALAMESGSFEAVFGAAPGGALGTGPRRFHVSPDQLRPEAIGRSCPIAYVIAPSYDRNDATALDPVGRAEALTLLVRNSFNFDRFGSAGLALLANIVKTAQCYRLRVADLESAVRIIEDLTQADD